MKTDTCSGNQALSYKKAHTPLRLLLCPPLWQRADLTSLDLFDQQGGIWSLY